MTMNFGFKNFENCKIADSNSATDLHSMSI
jgi:hypothetical protein